MAVPTYLLRRLEEFVAAGEFDRARQLAYELKTGANTKMDRAVIADYAQRKGLKLDA